MEQKTSKSKTKKKRKIKQVIQTHHVFYEPEIVTRIYKGQHFMITNLNRTTKNISLGFIHCLLKWLDESILKAKDLDKENIEEKRPIYRNRLFDWFLKGKDKVMKLERIQILDTWQNLYNDKFYFKVLFEDKLYLVILPSQNVEEEGTMKNVLKYIDKFFPVLDAPCQIQEIKDIEFLKD